jgi:hypothetical protein
MRRTRTAALARFGGRRSQRQRVRLGRSESLGASLARVLPALVAIPILFLLVRYRAPVTRAVLALVNALENAGASTQPPPPIAASQRPPATLPAAPTLPGELAADTTEAADTTDTAKVTDGEASAAAPAPAAADAIAPDEGEDSIPGDGSLDCPANFPVKGNATSKIYHLPDTSYYTVTRASVCFRSPEAAERAGFRASKSSPIRPNDATSAEETNG